MIRIPLAKDCGSSFAYEDSSNSSDESSDLSNYEDEEYSGIAELETVQWNVSQYE